ncbi:3-deoxy-D-manno-octulosonic acid transferase [Thalassorhabdomicrobium marinisediminis]|uniref:3-deoxy-D-manno-octulosonic acid transferase n=1 Tax=Thalassorhabdomicrobium marinisediminis TaxID=2170577 RepID=A0A2T7FX04_9RHOB|nr:glycosyltransferase N-terminal domain-containing protein [Thalassorhabdomicrobium marinisediminis]PVA06700.1 3-deoxy-D-manno-octulosonic acid transferase [Thalassorhabdomicrobium marinisediminis]
MILFAFSALYPLLWVVLTTLVLAYLWHRSRRDPLYFKHLGERFGRYDALPQRPVWIHAVSLGETRSAVPLARDLLAAGERVVFTHFTPAGRREAQAVFGAEIAAGQVASVWVPLDMGWTFARFFRACRPKIGLTMEIEIWPAMILAAKRHGVPFYLCNAQYPVPSLARDSRGLRLRQRIMAQVAGAFVKSDLQAERFAGIGLGNIHVTGELRFDQPIPPALLKAAEDARAALPPRPVITIASAVEGEDALYIDTIRALLDAPVPPLVIYVPRAPERFDAVAQMLQAAGLTIARRSVIFDAALRMQSPWPKGADVLLGDSMGEMYFYLSLAQRVVVGGGFHPKGAHNVIEPLALGKPVVTGPVTHTIEFPFREAEAAGVALSVADGMALINALGGPSWTSAERAQAFMAEHRGASARTAAAILGIINGGDAAPRRGAG